MKPGQADRLTGYMVGPDRHWAAHSLAVRAAPRVPTHAVKYHLFARLQLRKTLHIPSISRLLAASMSLGGVLHLYTRHVLPSTYLSIHGCSNVVECLDYDIYIADSPKLFMIFGQAPEPSGYIPNKPSKVFSRWMWYMQA